MKDGKSTPHYSRPSKTKKPEKRKDNAILLLVILISLSIISLLRAYYVTQQIIASRYHSQELNEHVSFHSPVTHLVRTEELLDREEDFRKSIKSCLPFLSKSCKTRPGHEIAILTPPGEFGDWVFDWIKKIVTETDLGSSVRGIHLHRESRISHKHEWSQLIRIMPTNLMLASADALRSTLKVGEDQHRITEADLQTALQVYLRWHCQISQIANTTSTFNLNTHIIKTAPLIAKANLLKFLNISAVHHKEKEEEGIEDQEDEGEAGQKHLDHANNVNGQKHSHQLSYFGASCLLTWIEQNDHIRIQPMLSKVLAEEMQTTNNFRTCQSVSNSLNDNSSEFTRRLVEVLAPNS